MLKQSVAIIGLGYVGLPLAILADKKGFKVVGIDADASKVAAIQQGASPFYDPEVTADLAKTSLTATSDITAIADVDTIVVCVPTPVDENYNPDLTPVRNACTAIAHNLHAGQLIIIESTINPGVCDEVIIPLLEEASGLSCGTDFYLAHCPERINPGDTRWNVSNIARVVGGNDAISLKRATAFYAAVVDAPIKPMGSLKEAEAVKVVENSFRDINIAFVNELAMSFTKLGIDVVNVIDGAATKPFAFMPHYPGAGVGGHCIPVDPYYLIEYAQRNGFSHEFLRAARGINNAMPEFAVERCADGLEEAGIPLKGARVTVLGLSYKPDVGDLRESPALEIIEILKRKGAHVAAFDPYITAYEGGVPAAHADAEREPAAFYETATALTANDDLRQAVQGADAVLIATAHAEFKQIDPTFLKAEGIKVVADGRNYLNKAAVTKAGLIYRGIGR